MVGTAQRTVEFAQLEDEIREKAENREAVETTLATSERIIARVTDGIYREPWAAFRELVANAYDADASYVVIETGQPDFQRMTVRDDGIGMSPKTLAYILKNIGGSSKRTVAGAEFNTVHPEAPDASPGGRPLIGKIGIGMFAVAQLTQHFQIITKAAGERHRLSATVRLRTHDEEELQKKEEEYVAGKVVIVSEKVPVSEIDSHGTSVVLYQLRNEVRRTLQSARRWEAASVEAEEGQAVTKPPQYHIGNSMDGYSCGPSLPWSETDDAKKRFDRFFEASGSAAGRSVKSANLDHFDEYLRLIWKLSLSLPLNYIGTHPFDLDGSDKLHFLKFPDGEGQAENMDLSPTETLREHLKLQTDRERIGERFSVTLDGVELRRPIRLTRELATKSRVGAPVIIAGRQDNPFEEKDLERAGGRLSFEAYLYWNSRVVPKETAGVLIRIRGASGTLFERTFLNYLVSEQTRLRQITAEVFVHEGLDSAINIDRESFNYSHPHFLFIQKWLHRALRLLVNRLKAIAKADLERDKAKLRDETLRYALEIWNRRLGEDADPPFAEGQVVSLPRDVGDAEMEWPTEQIRTGKGKAAGPVRISALAAVLEAYGVLSGLDVEDRAQIVRDVLGIPETDG
ncbi:MAG: ATP-binding protein [Rhodospirillaceae bacterium]|nr:ATP-binding protein [Rhodospirillaceae bacterium]MDE0363779.1 ATP-binding protein [Rhodospirillaceae bacterium]